MSLQSPTVGERAKSRPLVGKSAFGTRCLVLGLAVVALNDGRCSWLVPRGIESSRALATCNVNLRPSAASPVACNSVGTKSLVDAAAASPSPIAGYLACLVACVCFGSCNIPVKRTDVRDGMFFTLCKAGGVLSVGVLQWFIAGRYRFEPFAMVGGALWATGNVFVPFIIQRCGLGVGQLVWGVTSMFLGWASGTFGLFGKNVDVIGNRSLNYVGVAVAVLSLGLFSLMKKPATGKPGEQTGSNQRFLQGFSAAIAAGFFLGLNFNPSTYLAQLGQLDKAAGLPAAMWSHSTNPADYVISHYCGIFLTTAMYFLAYWIFARKKYCGTDVVFPGVASGIMWGIAQMAWFTANGVLSYVVAFPIIVSVPGVISALWGVLLFGENSGRRNLSLLALVIVLQIVGVSFIAMSKGV
eukprot:TRINITY_DN80677_c0_g1_i1.p1 TRINITY_DN80677_c0_g1~~TRINITY_DN80677_c0_g1_i1.p1  ORF type:complete len:425 (-),score=33.56 TRINITY_DN80677_c0_g1_i1:176-1408(-)